MAKKTNNEPWLLLTFTALIAVAGVFYAFLFPDEAAAFIEEYWLIATPVIVLILAVILGLSVRKRFKQRREEKLVVARDKQIKLAEQLIWRSRYSLESQKAQIVNDNDPESRELWSQAKQKYIRAKLYPVVSEQIVPVTLASALIENTLSGNRFRTGRLPSYDVTDVDDQYNL